MKFYHVTWRNYEAAYQSLLVTCNSKAQAKRLIKECYPCANSIKVRELNGSN